MGPQVTSHLVAAMHRGEGRRENANAPRRKGVRKKRRGTGLKEKTRGKTGRGGETGWKNTIGECGRKTMRFFKLSV